MKLTEIHFDWSPVIPGADARGEGLLFPLRGQSIFRASDGWSIERVSEGVFRLHREGMPSPVVVGDGYVYVEERTSVERVEPWDAVGGMMASMLEEAGGDEDLVAEKVLAATAKPKRQRKAKS